MALRRLSFIQIRRQTRRTARQFEAALAPTLDATVEIHSDDGSVRIEEGVLDSIETTEGTTRGTVGDGSGQLTIRIDDGDVRLSPLSTAE